MDRKDIPFLSATRLASLIENKEVSPVEAVEAYLERIQRLDSQLNAYITVCGEEARRAAQVAEVEIAGGRYRGPLHGVPVAVKDQIHTRDIRTTDASKIRAGFIPQEDATVVANLKQAGAVLLGKLNRKPSLHPHYWLRSPLHWAGSNIEGGVMVEDQPIHSVGCIVRG
jgi:Asp-tRNA(Asn)/Glu-tRNA(Gln) amidotransferase A subunit family amidase